MSLAIAEVYEPELRIYPNEAILGSGKNCIPIESFKLLDGQVDIDNDKLTPTELRAFVLASAGFIALDAGDLVDNKEWTMKTHLKSVFRKLGTHCIEQSVAVGFDTGLYVLRQPLTRQRTLTSTRQLDILQYTAEGMSDDAIGRKLFLSENTIKTHTKRMRREMDVPNRPAMVLKAYMSQLLPRD